MRREEAIVLLLLITVHPLLLSLLHGVLPVAHVLPEEVEENADEQDPVNGIFIVNVLPVKKTGSVSFVCC